MHHRYAVVVQDLATQWIQSNLCNTNSAQETQRNLRNILRPEETPRSMYTDNTQEVIKPCEELNWTHERSMPRRSETNGIAERVAQGVKEGTSSVSVQSGLQECWWAEAMECYCYLRNGHDLLADSQTPYERRFLHHLKGRVFIWSRSKILSNVIKRPRSSSASVPYKSPSWEIH